MSKKIFLKGTLILACTGLISRIAGFFYRIFLSHAIGAEGLGIYQLIFPVFALSVPFIPALTAIIMPGKKPLFRQPCSFRSSLHGSALPISYI